MSILRAEKITKVYGSVEALRDVDIEIADRDVTVIMGPSGSGKTTLLNLLALLDRPTSGTVFLNEAEITGLEEKKAADLRNRNFGFIFQFFYLLPELTVLENVFLPLWVKEKGFLKAGRYQAEAKRLLAEFHLEGKENSYPGQLSGGELQRVAICRSLICQPQIIFADEPTGSIDKDSARIFFELIATLNRERGVTFLIATHNEKFLQLATSVVYLREGRVERTGPS